MPDPRFQGAGVALVTPFDEAGVNEEVLRGLVAFHHEEGTDAFIICGSTGEAATMSPAEQRRALEIVIDENDRQIPVIAGCGGSETRAVIELANQAREVGADAILLSAPPYNRPTQEGLIAHFRAVIGASKLPTVIYNVPSRAAVDITPETIATLAEDERVIAVKEASGDISQVAELARLVGDRLAIWSGNDDQIVPLLSLGGSGVISVVANVAPRATSEMVHHFLEGRVEEARRLQLEYLPLIETLFAESNPIPVKAAVEWLGFNVGDPRLPLTPASAAVRSELEDAMLKLGIERRGG